MNTLRSYRIKDLARLTGVSVRTLHHYDAIGLVVPQRSERGYRLYGEADLLRLQQILIQRALGFSLAEIGRVLDDPAFDRKTALLQQRAALEARAEAAARMIRAIDHALASIAQEHAVDPKDLFDGFNPADHEAETKARWGETDAYKEASRRTRGYTAEDWRRLEQQQSAVYRAAAAAMTAGEPPEGKDARRIAEDHRLLIDRWFYPCSHAMHACLADMYEADPRFRDNIDRFGADLTPFLAAAMRANARGVRGS